MIGVGFGLLVLYSEGGVWRVLSLISVALGLFGGLAYWLFERAERRALPSPASNALSSEPHIAAHTWSSRHRDSIMRSGKCGCFHCLAVFPPSEIQNWVDDNTTAMCPKCGIDSVIGDVSGYPITPVFLGKMQAHWFQ